MIMLLAATPLMPSGHALAADPQANQSSPAVIQQQERSVSALLERLQRQVQEDHLVSPQNDNGAATMADILVLLQHASVSDLQLVLAACSQFARNAQQAQTDGRTEDAIRFVAVGKVLTALISREGVMGAPERPPLHDQQPTSSPEPTARADPVPPDNTPAASAMVTPRSGLAVMPNPSTTDQREPESVPTPAVIGPIPPSREDPANVTLKRVTPRRQVANADPDLGRSARDALRGEPDAALPAARSATATDLECRAIAVKFELGEEPSDAERSYLRKGCR